jgi:hypothetical protein
MKMHKQSFLCQLVSILDPLISSSKRTHKVCEVEVVSQAVSQISDFNVKMFFLFDWFLPEEFGPLNTCNNP